MKTATLFRYVLPMDSGVILRHTRLSVRNGMILELNEAGRVGRGEIAPLPEFSQETDEEAQLQAIAVLTSWLNEEPIDWDSLYPSVAFGISVALAELNEILPLAGHYAVAPLCSGDPDELLQKLAHMPSPKTAKVKVGMYEAVRDGMVVNMLLDVVPDLRLRLDANRKWTLDKAGQFVKYINPTYRSRIAFLEEPCQTPAESVAFALDTGIQLAWDESLREKGFELKKDENVAAIVIKPTLIGSLETVQLWVEKAHELGIEPVISSSLESSFGLNQLARIAHWLAPKTLPGLDTVTLFAQQLEIPWPECPLPLIPLSDCEIAWTQCAP